MHFIRKFRIPALFCALSVLVCELIGHPFAEMAVSDDGAYILTARSLSLTGHILYNGWDSPMLGWQLYLGAAFIKLFGFSYSAVRMSTLLVAIIMAFLIQRILVRFSLTEFNATIATLALVLSPLYLLLSVTYMTDIFGLFAVVICLYGCLRALQAPTPRSAILWLIFAVVTNAIGGTSRQVAWLGLLVMVPSTLWLLRAQRRIFLAGVAATFAGVLFIVACLHWFSRQPYILPEHLLPRTFSPSETIGNLLHFFLDIPFLLFPVMALFIPELRKARRPVAMAIITAVIVYALAALRLGYTRLLEPAMRNRGDWVSVHGIHEGPHLQGTPPIFLHSPALILLTIASIGGLLGLIASLLRAHHSAPAPPSPTTISWKQLSTLLAPVAIAYILVLIPRAVEGWFFDRYALLLLLIALIYLFRYYQDQVQPRLPAASILLITITAIYGIVVVHNQFSLYRARVNLAAQLRANNIPDTSVDNGWEYNLAVELQHVTHVDGVSIVSPAHARLPPQPGNCQIFWYDLTPHVHPLYSISFAPDTCYGPAPFAPIHYSRWLASHPGTLYIVNSIPAKR